MSLYAKVFEAAQLPTTQENIQRSTTYLTLLRNDMWLCTQNIFYLCFVVGTYAFHMVVVSEKARSWFPPMEVTDAKTFCRRFPSLLGTCLLAANVRVLSNNVIIRYSDCR